MKTKSALLLLASLLLLGTVSAFGRTNTVDHLKSATDDIKKEKDRLAVQSALVDFNDNPKLTEFFEHSYAVVVFPTVGKGGLFVGGAHGTGWAFREGKLAGVTKMTQVTVGFQAGGQAFSQLIFFEDERAFNQFTSGNFELGAQASAVALTAGANAQASTAGGTGAGANESQAKSSYSDGLAIFTMAKGGLMYEASVGGQKFSYKSLEK